MTLGGTVQLAAAHCPNERTLDPAVCPSHPHYGLHTAMFSDYGLHPTATTHYFSVASITRY